MHKNTQKVKSFLETTHCYYAIKTLPDSTRTAQEAANTLDCSVARIAKSIIFKNANNQSPVLVVASGCNNICLNKIKSATGLILAKADASYVKSTTGFPIGGVPPVSHDRAVTMILDNDLRQYDTIWAAAGTPHSVFELKPLELGKLTQGLWIDLAENK